MFSTFQARNHHIFLRMGVVLLVDRATMMLLHRFNILDDIYKLRMIVVLVLGNWRIIDRLRWTIGAKVSFIHAAYITHVIIIIAVHSIYPLPVLEYTLLYSQKGNAACTYDMEGDSLASVCRVDGGRTDLYRHAQCQSI